MVSARGYSCGVQPAAGARRAERRRRRTRVVAKPASSGAEAASKPASAQSRSGKTLPSGKQATPREHVERSHRLPSSEFNCRAICQPKAEISPFDAGSTGFVVCSSGPRCEARARSGIPTVIGRQAVSYRTGSGPSSSTPNTPTRGYTGGVFRRDMDAGTGFEPVTFRL